MTNEKILNLCKVFANNSSANTKLPKPQLSKIGQSVGYLGRLLGKLLKTGFTVIENILKPLAENVLIQSRLTTASATDAGIQEKRFGIGYVSFGLCKVNNINYFKSRNE